MNKMLDAGFWMPVEDPVFHGDKIWNLFFYVSSIQYQLVKWYNCLIFIYILFGSGLSELGVIR
jgi:steroid 5-alpha reductase family enzyme